MIIVVVLAVGLLLAPTALSRAIYKLTPEERAYRISYRSAVGDRPIPEIAVHNIGNVALTVSNIGQFGTGYLGAQVDPVTGTQAPSCIFPTGSNINYMYVGSFWIGAVVGRDTLVSCGVDDYYNVIELWPDPPPIGNIERKSIQPSSQFFTDDAISEQDIIAVYTDTVTDPSLVNIDTYDGRPHIPLNIEITQRSYAWSYEYAQDFILFDYSIKNIGRKTLDKVYMGIYVDGDVHHTSRPGEEGYGEDLCGFKRTYPVDDICPYTDTVNYAYIMDNDGDPSDQTSWSSTSARGAAGVKVVRTPSDSLTYSFNWWATNYNAADDFGPRRAGTPDDPFRDMLGVLGTPLGDRNKYYVMRHPEFDYDQMFAAKDHTADGWLPSPANAVDMSDGFDARYLLSFGPFSIYPGEVLPVTFAFICGDNLHTVPTNFRNLFSPYQPERFYASLDFSSVAENSRWASWVYDNPGVDTDGNGFRGKFRVCVFDSIPDTLGKRPPEIVGKGMRDTVFVEDGWIKFADVSYYEGDGVPDFKGASPPTPPVVRIFPRLNQFNAGELVIRWNGLKSEMEEDAFSGTLDFEGYRVYQSLSPVLREFALVSSYDRENFNRYIWDRTRQAWRLLDLPFSLDSLRAIYGEHFDPANYPYDHPLHIPVSGEPDSVFYFVAQDWNQSELRDTIRIHKRFPDEPFPSTLNPDTARIYFPEELTDEGYFKYFDYQYVLRNLLPSQLYYISVTAFDYGSPGHGLTALETKPTINMVAEYPQNDVATVERQGLNVVVYPNPYRIDRHYRSVEGGGFEGRGQEELPAERTRAIHFTNLPHKCIIRIFSIDGDLVREINHDCAPGSPQCMHDKWDLITRNTQAVASGIYYYSVESEFGNQIGKIVIIL